MARASTYTGGVNQNLRDCFVKANFKDRGSTILNTGEILSDTGAGHQWQDIMMSMVRICKSPLLLSSICFIT